MMTLLALLAAAQQPATATPRTLVDAIYRHYRAGGEGLGDDSLLALLSPATRAKYDKALPRDADEVVIEGDPFCDCQDFSDITVEMVTVSPVRSGRATANVRIVDREMEDGDRNVTIRMIRTPQGWRVEDVGPVAGPSLLDQITPARRKR